MKSLLLLVAILICVSATWAQMPPRAELTAQPKYAEDAPHTFQNFTEAQLRTAITVLSARSYAVFGYNTPEVRILLPKAGNSSYAEVEFSEPVLKTQAGKPVKFELENGVYDEEKYSNEIRFRSPDGDAIVTFARATGHVKVKYPRTVQTLALTPSQLGPKELALKIDGPFVSYAEEAVQIPEVSFVKLRPIRAYDSAGHLLERYSMSETSTDDDGVDRVHMAFYGNVARMEIDSVQDWAELDLPYDLTPAALLPAGHEGEDPEAPQQE